MQKNLSLGMLLMASMLASCGRNEIKSPEQPSAQLSAQSGTSCSWVGAPGIDILGGVDSLTRTSLENSGLLRRALESVGVRHAFSTIAKYDYASQSVTTAERCGSSRQYVNAVDVPLIVQDDSRRLSVMVEMAPPINTLSACQTIDPPPSGPITTMSLNNPVNQCSSNNTTNGNRVVRVIINGTTYSSTGTVHIVGDFTTDSVDKNHAELVYKETGFSYDEEGQFNGGFIAENVEALKNQATRAMNSNPLTTQSMNQQGFIVYFDDGNGGGSYGGTSGGSTGGTSGGSTGGTSGGTSTTEPGCNNTSSSGLEGGMKQLGIVVCATTPQAPDTRTTEPNYDYQYAAPICYPETEAVLKWQDALAGKRQEIMILTTAFGITVSGAAERVPGKYKLIAAAGAVFTGGYTASKLYWEEKALNHDLNIAQYRLNECLKTHRSNLG